MEDLVTLVEDWRTRFGDARTRTRVQSVEFGYRVKVSGTKVHMLMVLELSWLTVVLHRMLFHSILFGIRGVSLSNKRNTHDGTYTYITQQTHFGSTWLLACTASINQTPASSISAEAVWWYKGFWSVSALVQFGTRRVQRRRTKCNSTVDGDADADVGSYSRVQTRSG